MTTNTMPRDNLVRMWTQPVALRSAGDDAATGNTMVGHFAVFDQWTEIDSWWEGRFLERIGSTAFDRTFTDRAGQIRVLYDHGHDPMIGNKPLGDPKVLRADKIGAYAETELFDVSYVNDLKPAISAGQMGQSFRFRVTAEEIVVPKAASEHNPEKLPERTITDLDLYEFGPVTFPAYSDGTTPALRSRSDEFIDRLARDPLFVARFTERVGLNVAERILADVPADGRTKRGAETPADGRDEEHCIRIARARALAYTL